MWMLLGQIKKGWVGFGGLYEIISDVLFWEAINLFLKGVA